MTLTLEGIGEVIANRFPELSPRIEEERAYHSPDDPGSDVFLAEVFTRHLANQLSHLPESRDEVKELFRFVEDLASSNDSAVVAACVVSVIEPLESTVGFPANSRGFLGPFTRQMVPTWDWFMDPRNAK